MTVPLTTNIAPINFVLGASKLYEANYEDVLNYDELRQDDRYVTTRVGASVFSVPKVSSTGAPSGEFSISLVDAFPVQVKKEIVAQSLLSWAKSLKRVILRSKQPLEFELLNKGEGKLGSLSLPKDTLWVSKTVRIHVRETTVDQVNVPCLVIDTGVHLHIKANCKRLVGLGLLLKGRYVSVGSDVGAVGQRLAGRVVGYDAGTDCLSLDDFRNSQSLPAKDCYVEATHGNFLDVAQCILRKPRNQLQRMLKGCLDDWNSGSARKGLLKDVHGYLMSHPIASVQESKVEICHFLKTDKLGVFKPTERRIFAFDHRGSKLSDVSLFGLNSHGPLSATAIKRPVRVCLLAERSKLAAAETLANRLLFGDQRIGWSGFQELFRIPQIELVTFDADDYTIGAYSAASAQALVAQHSSSAWTFALAQVRAKDGSPGEDPYLGVKASFMSAGIPIQTFTDDTLGQADNDLKYTVKNLALACFCKAGGVPWLLRRKQQAGLELVVGFGSTLYGTSRLSAKSRLVGVTTVFSADGNFWLSGFSQPVPEERKLDAIADALKGALRRTKTMLQPESQQPLRLVLHASKPISRREASLVANTLSSELRGIAFEFALLSVSEDGPYILFDEHQKELIPPRGVAVRLSHTRTLLVNTGPERAKRPGKGFPRPLVLELHPSSTLTDWRYLANQALDFCSHNWRGFGCAPLPVSIHYSNLMARLASKLQGSSAWNPSVLLGKTSDTKWFL